MTGAQLLIRKSRQEGREEEARSLLILMGRKRLGEPGKETEARIAVIADRERLERLCQRVLDVETWEDLLAGS